MNSLECCECKQRHHVEPDVKQVEVSEGSCQASIPLSLLDNMVKTKGDSFDRYTIVPKSKCIIHHSTDQRSGDGCA